MIALKDALTLAEKLARIGPWTAPELPEDIPHGDMPGDKVCIDEDHIRKAALLFPKLVEALKELEGEKAVVSVFGGSGVGKSEIASLLGWYLRSAGIGSYVISGDNYPHRIPMYNDAERLRVFRVGGLRGLLAAGLYDPDKQRVLDALWPEGLDAGPAGSGPLFPPHPEGAGRDVAEGPGRGRLLRCGNPLAGDLSGGGAQSPQRLSGHAAGAGLRRTERHPGRLPPGGGYRMAQAHGKDGGGALV